VEGISKGHDELPARLAHGALAALARDFRDALLAPDVRRAHRLVAEAADAGTSAGALYVSVIRPSLVELQYSGPRAGVRLAGHIGEALLSDLVQRLPFSDRDGLGRAAVLSCRDAGIEAVDGSVAMDFLEADGWSVERLAGDHRRPQVAELAAGGSLELAVAVTSGPEEALRLAPVCTALRRLADPPVILLCDFSGRPHPHQSVASSSLGADAVALDPEELVRHAARRLPRAGRRRWGVRLSRTGESLTLTPTGSLDAVSVARLLDVVDSRAGTFRSLTLDLRDLAGLETTGLTALEGWGGLAVLDGIAVDYVVDPLQDATLGDALAQASVRVSARSHV
jgi:hypothetical protein